jgi:hypothetical protein
LRYYLAEQTMDLKDRIEFAELFRRTAQGAIPEEEFWSKLSHLSERVDKQILELAQESAIHYWGNFHQRNILFICTKPNRGQLVQGQNELNLIAQAIESGWEPAVLEEKLEDI